MIEFLRAQQDRSVRSIDDTIQSIEINPIDICNRGCSFCPRGHGYTNTSNRLDTNTSRAINRSLKQLGFDGHMTFAGFGEPLLHKDLERQIELITDDLSVEWVEVITNGDMLSHDRAFSLVVAGVTHITISMYDQDDSKRFEDMLRGLNVAVTFKHLYGGIPNEVNRVEQYRGIAQPNRKRACYLPFYRTFVDYNGDVLLCCNDWSKRAKLGNVNTQTLKDMWFGDIIGTYRQSLIKKRRDLQPCLGCNVDGIMHGKECFDLFKEHYVSIENTNIEQASSAK